MKNWFHRLKDKRIIGIKFWQFWGGCLELLLVTGILVAVFFWLGRVISKK